MILTDAGPLVAIIDSHDPDHQRCVEALTKLTAPFVTTWAAFTEAMYLLGRSGWRGHDRLWDLCLRGDLEIAELDLASLARCRELMKRYQELPMDLADATLVALAEQRGLKRIFTLDGDFQLYRLPGRKSFDIVP